MLLGTSLTTDDDFTGRPESVRAEEIADAAFSRNQLGDGFSRRGVVVHVSEDARLPASVEPSRAGWTRFRRPMRSRTFGMTSRWSRRTAAPR